MTDLIVAVRSAPHPFQSLASGPLRCEYRADVGAAVRRAYETHEWVYDALRERPFAEAFRGRRPVVAGRLGDHHVVVKRMYHGGLFGRLTGDAFLTPKRARAHVALAEYLAERGIPTASVLFTAWRRKRGFVRCEIGFEWIEGAVDADRFFFGPEQRRDWEERADALGSMVGELHRAGFEHGDLNLMNFLFDRDGRTYILDLDKSKCHAEPLSAARSVRNFGRLERSIRKQGREAEPSRVDAIIARVRRSWLQALAVAKLVVLPDLLSWGSIAQESLPLI